MLCFVNDLYLVCLIEKVRKCHKFKWRHRCCLNSGYPPQYFVVCHQSNLVSAIVSIGNLRVVFIYVTCDLSVRVLKSIFFAIKQENSAFCTWDPIVNCPGGSEHEDPGLVIPVVRPKPLRTWCYNQVPGLSVWSSSLTVTHWNKVPTLFHTRSSECFWIWSS